MYKNNSTETNAQVVERSTTSSPPVQILVRNDSVFFLPWLKSFKADTFDPTLQNGISSFKVIEAAKSKIHWSIVFLGKTMIL